MYFHGKFGDNKKNHAIATTSKSNWICSYVTINKASS